ncbi:MAG: hypothetical protein EPN38_03790 [Rhodanobacteraceae bacterium]|nr:MAG: hypothetical protein EPN38_03790 [Rhodanobacteraceae bacterium]
MQSQPMQRDVAQIAYPAVRRVAVLAVALAGGIAVAVSQLHVMPPMLCFALLVAGMATLGAAGWLAARRWLAGVRPRPQVLTAHGGRSPAPAHSNLACAVGARRHHA